jgi:glutamate formiminotransferase
MTDLAGVARDSIDLTKHEGVHPRVGALDVCPFVPHQSGIDEAVAIARRTARDIGNRGLPVFLYGAAREDRSLPELRRGGLEGVSERVAEGDIPDFGPHEIEPASGVVCVGARGPLIAFNVNIDSDPDVARAIAKRLREQHGSDGLRALGLLMPRGSQVSMNITDPVRFGIEEALDAVERVGAKGNITITSTELVGLVEQRFLPPPDAKATRLLLEPGRSVESVL